MNEELKKLLDSIKEKKQQVKNLCGEGKLEDAAKEKEELRNLQEKFDLLYDLEEEKVKGMTQKAAAGTVKNIVDHAKNLADAFANAIKAAVGKGKLSEEEREILNSMNEGTEEDGGLTVPKDIRTAVKELRRSEDALETLVNVERVSTLSGSRVIEKHADQTPFDNVDEEAEFPEVSTPQFEKIEYKVKKKGGILKVTQELLSDSTENIIGYLKKWIAKKAKATRNFLIVAKVREITKGEEVPVEDLDDLKRIFNVTLDPAIALTSSVITNQDGYNWLDSLKDDYGRYVLQPDPSKPMNTRMFGKYPVIKVGNKTLKSIAVEGGFKVPIICGDLKEAITLFDRETMTIDISSTAGELWGKDQTGIKVRERLDVASVDETAVIMAEYFDLAETNGNGKYEEAELKALTKEKILDMAKLLGYTMTTTINSTKTEIVTEFLEQQALVQ